MRPSVWISPLRLNCDSVSDTVSRVDPIRLAISWWVIFSATKGQVYSYNPATGAQNWVATTRPSGAFNTGAPPAAPVVSDDGAVYIADDAGTLWQIDNRGGGTAGVAQDSFDNPSGAAFQTTPIPPLPMGAITWYGPNLLAASSDITAIVQARAGAVRYRLPAAILQSA